MKYLKILPVLFACLLQVESKVVAQNLHAKRYEIHIDTLVYAKQNIYGHTKITLQALSANLGKLNLQLLKMQVDSVKSVNGPLAYAYNDTNLVITPGAIMQPNDTIDVWVYYHGKPYLDPRFGGFSFSGVFAFNIGVGFISDPHNLGKAWFPCVDNFTDKALYEFYVTTPSGNKAFCNGLLLDSLVNANKSITWHWKIKEILPTYLASVAVAPFHTIRKTYHGLLPIEWAVLPEDSANTVKTFAKIDTALSCFISSYGPYPYEKVGYVLVPFTGGAMEHASSIHIGKVFVNGTLTYETMWAHELSHMWWGDKVTCSTAEDMWLNEGWASFNEARFTEWAYGTTAYKNFIRDNHWKVIRLANLKDLSYLALDAVPHDFTYGSTVYNKGEGVVHTLRGLLGDAAFFQACKDYMNAYAYGNASSLDMKSVFSTSSGRDLSHFFADWVSTPGFPHFSIDSTHISPVNGKYEVTVYTRQRARGNTHVYDMNVECAFSSKDQDSTLVLKIDSIHNRFVVTLPFSPSWIALDRKEKMCDAITDYENTFTKVDSLLYPTTNVKITVVNAGNNPSTVRVENNWVAPDPLKKILPGQRFSDNHYWKVDGDFAEGFTARGTFYYDGSYPDITYDPPKGYSDNDLIIDAEDSLYLFYRQGPGKDWKLASHQALHMGKQFDKQGNITVDSLKKGEYLLGISFPGAMDIQEKKKSKMGFKVVPNPALKDHSLKVIFPAQQKGTFYLKDVLGKTLQNISLNGVAEIDIPKTMLAAGIYIGELCVNGQVTGIEKIVIED